MRFNVGETLFAVYFEIYEGQRHFVMPMIHHNRAVENIEFVELEVVEHHRVPDQHDTTNKLNYDGFILTDSEGTRYVNQYPRSDCGQLSDVGNRRFWLHSRPNGSRIMLDDDDSPVIRSWHLLSDVLENMKNGLIHLGNTSTRSEYFAHAQEKIKTLQALYDRTISEFEQKFPEYKIDVVMEQPVKDSDFKWPRVYFRKREEIQPAQSA